MNPETNNIHALIHYMVMKTFGFDWLKYHRGVIFVMFELKQHKGSKFIRL